VRRALALVVLGGLGCTASPHGLSWTIDFETRALHDQTAAVEATIRSGSCTGAVLYRTTLRPSGSMMMTPPMLGPGIYGFAATAYDATCTPIGDDCQSITLPGTASVMDLIRAHMGTAACSASSCTSGVCQVDAGTPDAGAHDASAIDLGAAHDAAGDAGSMCTGVICPPCHSCDPTNGQCRMDSNGTACTNGVCASGACCTGCIDGTGACQSGTAVGACGRAGVTCAGCSECETCNGTSCVSASDGSMCLTGSCLNGHCCAGCAIVGTCQPGNTAAACGSHGTSCATCGECQTCNGAGTCGVVTDGTACTNGQCVSGACCTGCTSSVGCELGTNGGTCGFGGAMCSPCPSCNASSPNGGVCSGYGGSCAGYLEPPLGTTTYAIDTCQSSNSVQWQLPSCTGDPVPPNSAPSAVFSVMTPTGQFFVTAEAGWTVGALDTNGMCTAVSCANMMYSTSGGPPGRAYIAVARTDGSCGRVNIVVMHN
jgi:hypothetical protein